MTHEQEVAWRAGLKVGDTVVVRIDRALTRIGRCHVAVVDKSAPTQVTVAGSVYRRSDGAARGALAYHAEMIRPPTPSQLEDAKRAELLDKIEQYSARLSKFSTARLQAIYDAILLPLKEG